MRIEDCKSIGIRIEMEKSGLTEIEMIGDNGKLGDQRIEIYQVGAVRVANTNGDPIWEEQDFVAFAELLESEGIQL